MRENYKVISHINVCVCVCVCVFVCARAHMYTLRIVSMDKILRFTNTSIIIIIIKTTR